MYDIIDNTPRIVKKIALTLLYIILTPLSFIFSIYMRIGDTSQAFSNEGGWLMVGLMAVCVSIIHALHLDRYKLQGLHTTYLLKLAATALMLGVSLALAAFFGNLSVPRSAPAIFTVVFFASASLTTLILSQILTSIRHHKDNRLPVAIYGAGAAGMQLASALRHSSEVQPVLFVDDNPAIHNLQVVGLKVISPDMLKDKIQNGVVKRILIAIPSITDEQRKTLFERLVDLNCDVQTLPSYVDLISGTTQIELQTVTPDDLLGREAVNLPTAEIAAVYSGQNILVTGAGGSIGSELCRQLVKYAPARLILLEISEFGLYQIDSELRENAEMQGVELVPRLGSVTDLPRIRGLIKQYDINIVLHAAAYKHVPLVEENEIQGARNNTIGTEIVAQEACAAGAERFILVSTDKVVRPTNVMGATKRMAEMVLQDMQLRHPDTKISMVRFGNVLGSSGSVIPRFQQQIRSGGPVTVTHEEVTRYFMTIPEAVSLVLTAGVHSKGGDVFVLDMGEPVRIVDLARRMIRLSGARVQGENGQIDGGIEIQITGLRRGEKLYEELLIDHESLKGTPHPKIFRAEEKHLSNSETMRMMTLLHRAVDNNDPHLVRHVASMFVKSSKIMQTGDICV